MSSPTVIYSGIDPLSPRVSEREANFELVDNSPPGCSAENVEAGPARYVVTHTHGHKSLKVGDVVVMGETPRMENVLIRLFDMTIHGITGEHDQYVHLRKLSHGSD